jgi:aldose 1-epimerase
MNINKTIWGELEGQTVWRYELSGPGITVKASNFGCSLLQITLHDEAGGGRDMLLSYDHFEDLLKDSYYTGAMIGRYAGRIAGASFSIENRQYTLAANDGQTGNHLHGGYNGFHKKYFRETICAADEQQARLQLSGKSLTLEEGYPGNLDIVFSLVLTERKEVRLQYEVTTDAATFINLTHHPCFTLGAANAANILKLQINAAKRLEYDNHYIPNGNIIPALNEYDFRQAKCIPASISFNEYYIFSSADRRAPRAILSNPLSGDSMEVYCSHPGLLFYSGDFLHHPFQPRQGICLETQDYPNAPNIKDFPDTLYYPGKPYQAFTEFRFKN